MNQKRITTYISSRRKKRTLVIARAMASMKDLTLYVNSPTGKSKLIRYLRMDRIQRPILCTKARAPVE
jgi:hypothetical protein